METEATNIELWVAVALGLMKVFETVARLTRTQTDNMIVERVRQVFAVLGVALPDRSK